MVGKVEAGIPEDDPRNPATIADNVGDNVGDCAGMAADLFETYVVTVGRHHGARGHRSSPAEFKLAGMVLPLAIGGACVVTSIIGTYFVKLGANNNIMGALYKGVIATGVLSLVALYPVHLHWSFGGMGAVDRDDRRDVHRRCSLFWCGVVGLIITAADHLDHRILHRHGQAPGQLDRRGLGHRPRHQRDPGPGGVDGSDRPAGAGHRRRHHRRPISSPASSARRLPSPPCWRWPA